ncbi:MAG: hypothetical protein Q4D94_12775 [Bacillota bacterium]|nr:hypothetical protein [Bacillota bacterium]
MKKKWTSGKIAAVVVGGIAAACVLLIAFYIGVFQLVKNIMIFDQAFRETMEAESENEQRNDGEAEDPLIAGDNQEEADDWAYDRGKDDPEDHWAAEPDKDENSFWDNEEYYEFHNDIKSDLSYQIEVKEFTKYAETNTNSVMTGNYPVVLCEDQKKADRINAAIKKELEVVFNHVNSIGENMGSDEYFIFDMESYVTYMEEDVLSVIYVEYAFLGEETYESYVVSVNIDMESGMEMTNSQILKIDDEFSIDFRKRSEKQNGESETMDYYSDQEITDLMNDDSTLIIFYAPLGMEVGFNYYYGWVTVTYPDYERYQSPL